MKSKLSEKHLGILNYICSDCAESKGATWSEDHCATVHTGICDACGNEKALSNVGDWNWPDGKRRGMRD